MILARLASRARALSLTAAMFIAGSQMAGAQQVTTIAGGYVGDGPTPAAAALYLPNQMAMDSGGNLYIADLTANRIRKITPAGVVSTVAGTGYTGFSGDGGQATQAQLFWPEGLAFDSSDNLYVSDRGNNRVRKITPAGVISTVAGDGTSAVLDRPKFLAVAPNGTIYVSETQRSRVRKIVNGVVSAFAGLGGGAYTGDNGPATNARLNYPTGLEVDASGNVFIADSLNNAIRKVDTSGIITTYASVSQPEDVAFDSAGHLLVLNDFGVINLAGNTQVVGGADGVYGFAGDGGNALGAVFNWARSLVIGSDDRIYINDEYNQRIRVVTNGVIDTWVGPGASGDGGQAVGALVHRPQGIAYDAAGNLYFSETYKNVIRKVTPAGAISTYAGTGQRGFSGDGGPATSATFDQPMGLAVMSDGTLLVADNGNSRIRSIATNGVISTFAGDGTWNNSATCTVGAATGPTVLGPVAVAVNAADDVFISMSEFVCKVHAGFVSAFAGGGFSVTDGAPATDTALYSPAQIGFDSLGNTYIADTYSHTVRKITPDGLAYIVAGKYQAPGNSALGGSALGPVLSHPTALAVEPNGDFWVGDDNARLSKVSNGMIQAVAGTGKPGLNGDGAALSTQIQSPGAAARNGNYLVFTDSLNSLVREMDTTPSALPTIAIGSNGAFEGNSGTSNLTFTVQLSSPAPAAISFDISTSNGTATAGSDYVATSLTGLTIAAGQTSTTFNVTINGDTTYEPSETFTVTLANVSGANVTASTATGTITNDDSTPVVPSVSIGDISVSEGNSGTKIATFTISLSQSTTASVSFDVATADGTATAGSDYVSFAQVGRTIPAGQTSTTVAVTVNGDVAVESDETFTVNLSNVAAATVAKGVAVGTITNDDVVSGATLSIGDVTVTEGNSLTKLATFTINLSAAQAGPVIVDVATADGTATAGSDYVAKSVLGLRIPAGSTSKTFAVTINGDSTTEPDESFTVNLSNASNASIADGQAVGTISNDDGAPPGLSLVVHDASIVEGNAGTTIEYFLVELSGLSSSSVCFDVQTVNGTGIAGADYQANSVHACMSPNQSTYYFPVSIIGDTGIEPTETFGVTLANASGANIADDSAVGTIVDDDTPIVLSLADASVVEGDSGVKYISVTASLSAASPYNVCFQMHTVDVTAIAGTDYWVDGLASCIAAGQTSQVLSLFRVVGDTVVEPDEHFLVVVDSADGASLGDDTADVTILNDDSYDAPVLSIADVSIAEGNSGTKTASFTVSLSKTPASTVSFDAATVNGTATAGSDYVALALTGQTIAAGQTSKTVSVTINGDTTNESDETFNLVISNVNGAQVVDDTGVGTITNDDSASGATLSIGDVSIAEGNSLTKTATFTVTLSAAQSGPVLVDVATANGTATAGSDYVAKTMAGLRIAAGTTSKTFAVTINGDTTSEADETFTVNLSNASGATIADGQGLGTITNDDAAATPTLSIADASVAEGNSGTKTLTFTVSLSPAASGTVSYDIATSNGTATAGSDYVASTLTGQTISAGATSKTFVVTINGDTTTEANETFNVTLSNVSGATLGDGSAVGTITNDDGGGTGPTLTIADVSIAEGNSLSRQLSFTVKLSAASTSAVTYNIATADGTAIAPTDYTAKTLTGLSIAAGATSKTFAVAIKGDTTVEPNETFLVNVSNVAGATVGDGQAVGTITNDDAAALTIARFDAKGIVDDVDDGNRQPQIAPSEYATLLADSATTMCRRAPNATVIAVEGVEHKQVLADLAASANAICAGKPTYAAVMADNDSRGFLVETPAKGEVGTAVLGAPEVNAAAKSTTVQLLGAGHATPVTLVLAQAASKPLLQQLQLRAKANPDEALVLLGANAANGLIDLTAREFGKPTLKSPLPTERLLVNPLLLRLYGKSAIALAPLPANEPPAQLLKLQ